MISLLTTLLRFVRTCNGKREILIPCFFSFKIEVRNDLSKEYSGSSYEADEKVCFPWANLDKKKEKINKQETQKALLILLRDRLPIEKKRSRGE